MNAKQRIQQLETQLADLLARVETLEAQVSVVKGRSAMNAERVVRTHSSVQNLSEEVHEMFAASDQLEDE